MPIQGMDISRLENFFLIRRCPRSAPGTAGGQPGVARRLNDAEIPGGERESTQVRLPR